MIAFWGVHVAAVAGVILCGFSWSGVALALGSYFIRMFVVTAAYHRYFSHRAFKTSRWFQFVLAVGAQSAAQRGVIGGPSHHRWHHKHSDAEATSIPPARRGFWYSHMGWVLGTDWDETDETGVAIWSEVPGAPLPEPRHLNAAHGRPCAGVPAVGGGRAWSGVSSCPRCCSGTAPSRSTRSRISSATPLRDGRLSRNNWALALLTTGEGWHNNHHHYQSSARQGFRWWEIDLTYYLLRLMALAGIIWDLRQPPRHVIDAPWPAP